MMIMDYAVLLFMITGMAIVLTITDGFTWLFVGLLQGGMGILTFTLRESGILTIPDGSVLPTMAVITLLSTGLILARLPARQRLLLSPQSVTVFLFSFLVVAGTLYSWHSLAIDKALKYIAANLVTFFAILFLPSRQRQRLYMLLLMVAVIITFGVMFSFVLGGAGSARGRYSTFSIDTITTARSIGLGLIMALYLPCCHRHRGAWVVFLGIGLLLAASRGPIAALFLTVLIQPRVSGTPLIPFRMQRRMMWLLGSVALGLAMLILVVMLFPPTILVENWGPLRLVRETTLLDRNILSRFEHWATSFQDAQLCPWIGLGTAGYAGSSPERDPELLSYPHNIFLEILSEWGLLGLILFLLMIGRSLTSIRRLNLSASATSAPWWADEARVVAALVMFTLINACVSGEIYNNRTLWLALGAVEVLHYEVSRYRSVEPDTQAQLVKTDLVP